MTFHDYFHDLRLSCRFRKFLKLSLFSPKAVQQTNSGIHSPPKCLPFAWLSCCLDLTLSSLALSSAATYLLYKSLIFHDFPGPTIKFHDFQGLENEILKFHDFPGFPWPVRTLYPNNMPPIWFVFWKQLTQERTWGLCLERVLSRTFCIQQRSILLIP